MVHNNVTMNGTEKSSKHPWTIDTTIYFSPEQRVIMGRVAPIVVAPPTEIGANFPKKRTRKGAASKAIISLIILDSRAIVPNSAPLYSVIIMLDNE